MLPAWKSGCHILGEVISESWGIMSGIADNSFRRAVVCAVGDSCCALVNRHGWSTGFRGLAYASIQWISRRTTDSRYSMEDFPARIVSRLSDFHDRKRCTRAVILGHAPTLLLPELSPNNGPDAENGFDAFSNLLRIYHSLSRHASCNAAVTKV